MNTYTTSTSVSSDDCEFPANKFLPLEGLAVSAPLRSKRGVGGGENKPSLSLSPRRERVQGEGETKNPWRNPDMTTKLYNELFAEKARKELTEYAQKRKTDFLKGQSDRLIKSANGLIQAFRDSLVSNLEYFNSGEEALEALRKRETTISDIIDVNDKIIEKFIAFAEVVYEE